MRTKFNLRPDQAQALIDAPDQDALNDRWQALGTEMGFVWTTVSDLQLAAPVIGNIGASFTAETTEPPLDPAFEAWFAYHFPDWQIGDSDTATGRVIVSMVSSAFEAGRRIAAETLGQSARTPASDHQLERLSQCFDQFCPAGVPIDGLSIDGIKQALEGINAAKAGGRRLFIGWAEPIIAEIERDNHSHESSMALGAALAVMTAFIVPATAECHRVIGTQAIGDLGGDDA
jgi:hypothetical protein